ncbi:MAG TPA: hypothetical protein PK523_10100, partial [Elusimicrobiales bacterium]|nr:hypothetical protein [Elusimicrobiales bacterium]
MKRFIMGVVAYFIFAGTAFAAAPEVMTYQGRLKENGLPVTGDRDIIITLCDAPSAGTCHPAVPTAQTVHVSTGLFKSTFTLPSGTDLSTGEWYLQVNVDTVDLLPREKLTAVPYALYSSSAAYAENAASAVLRTGDTMTGGLLVSGSSLTVVAPDTIPASLWVSSSAATPHLFVSTAGLVGLGTDSPDRPLHIVSRSGQVGLQIDGYDASYDTIYIDSKGGGVPGYGYLRGGLLRAMTSLDGFENLNLEVNGVNRMTIRPDGRVGLNTAAPSYLLHVSTPAGETGTIMAVSTGASNVFWVDGTAAHALKFIGDGSGLTGVTGATGDDPSALKLSGGNMTGQLTTASTITVQGGAFSVGGSTLVVGNGAVGIGISVPTAAFQVNGDWIMGSGSDFPGGGVAGWLHSPSGVLYEGGGVAWSHHFAAYGGGDIVRFGVSAASGDTPDTRAVITNSGWLGVGPGVPGALLHVSSGAGESGTIMAVSTGATNLFWVTGGGAHASRFVGDGSGLTNLPVGAIGGVIPVSQGGTGLASIAPDNLIYASAADTFAAAPLSPFARTLLDDGTSVDARSTLGLVIGSAVQAYDADLDDLADGSLTGSKVGPGVPAANIADGALGANV